MYVRKQGEAYELYVSIADVAHYVAHDSALDQEAYARSPASIFPIAPFRCCRKPVERHLQFEAERRPSDQNRLHRVNPTGEVIRSRFLNSVIRSHARMTYTDVRRILVDQRFRMPGALPNLVDEFKSMEELALLIYERRRRRGNLDFDLPEAEIILDLQGLPENIVRAERNVAHRIIEEFMIAANEAVARHLTGKDFPTLYRVHEGPDQEALEALAPFLLSLGYRLPQKKETIAPLEIQRLLESARGNRKNGSINRVLLRSMKQAVYQPENIGHFGLAPHATPISPRRYAAIPDLIVHRMSGPGGAR